MPKPDELPPGPRKAPVAPRRLPTLNADSLQVPDLPTDTDRLFGGVFSPDAVDFPGLSLIDGKDYGGLDTETSSEPAEASGAVREPELAPETGEASARAEVADSVVASTGPEDMTSTPCSYSSHLIRLILLELGKK